MNWRLFVFVIRKKSLDLSEPASEFACKMNTKKV